MQPMIAKPAEPMDEKKPGQPPTMTLALHAVDHQHILHSHTFPIFQTSTFVFDSAEHGASLFAGKSEGHIYSRLGNPTVEQFEHLMAKMEGGVAGLAFGSGMGAVASSIWPFVKAGDHVLWGNTLYGCSISLLNEGLPNYGVETTAVDTSDLDAVRKAIKKNTKLIFIESPANPTNKICDIAEIVKIAKEFKLVVVADNTFTTPVFLRPLEMGVDVVLHSVTKYINGHGDVVGGVVVAREKEAAAKIAHWRKDNGAIMAPMDAFLTLRGLRTLPLRMPRFNTNGITVARFLEAHPKISQVLHPALESCPGHAIAMKQQTGFGGTFSFHMRDGFDAAKNLCGKVKLATLAVSLGCLDTLIEHPASMTHACVPAEVMAKQGLTPNLVRISVGLEEPEDIIADLNQALEKC